MKTNWPNHNFPVKPDGNKWFFDSETKAREAFTQNLMDRGYYVRSSCDFRSNQTCVAWISKSNFEAHRPQTANVQKFYMEVDKHVNGPR